MILSQTLIDDAQALVNVFQRAATAEAARKALGVSELGASSAFNAKIYGGTAILGLCSASKWATASNEVVVYSQFQSMLENAGPAFEMPNLGPTAVVSFDGTDIAAPTLPGSPGTYRLRVDTATATDLRWEAQPANPITMANAITTPLTVVIGADFPPQWDLSFPTTAEFFTWLFAHVIFEPLTLVFSPDSTHEFRYPLGDFSYPLMPTYPLSPVDWQTQAAQKPVNLRPYFRGRGRLIFTSYQEGVVPIINPSTPFSYLSVAGVRLDVMMPITYNRVLGSTNQRYHWAINCVDCELHFEATSVVTSDGGVTVTPSTSRDSIYYSVRLHRCILDSSNGSGIHVTTAEVTAWNWGLIQFCTMRGFKLSAMGMLLDNPPTANYKATWNRVGWRIVNTKGRAADIFYRGTATADDEPVTYLHSPVNYTLVNCRLWLTDFTVGRTDSNTPVNLNLVNTRIWAQTLNIRDCGTSPNVIKLYGSSVLAKAMTVKYVVDQDSSDDVTSIDRLSLGAAPGWIHLVHSQFGVVEHVAELDSSSPQITGHAAVKPSIRAESYSRVYIPGSYTFDSPLVTFDSTSSLVTV